MKRTMSIVFGITMVSCLMLAGCQKAADKAIEAKLAKEGIKAKVDSSGEKVTVQSKDGTMVIAGGKGAAVPENFPKDVYVYEGATIIAAISMPDGFSLSMESSDSAEKAVSTFKSKMTGLGWKEEMVMNQGNHSMLSYKKGERAVVANIIADKKATQISVTVAEPKKK